VKILVFSQSVARNLSPPRECTDGAVTFGLLVGKVPGTAGLAPSNGLQVDEGGHCSCPVLANDLILQAATSLLPELLDSLRHSPNHWVVHFPLFVI